MIEEDPEALLARFAALPAAPALLRALATAEAEAYLVGGAVRDLMRGDSPADLDLIVPDGPEALAASFGADARLHDRFGTASLILDGVRVDLARPRRETYPRPGALPEVSPGSLTQDLGRRDFTVNTVALGLSGEARGQFESAPGALADVRTGRLRVLHPASFRDDPTRLLRLARYASRPGFAVEPDTLALVSQALREGAVDTVSGSRLGTELRLLSREPDAVAALGMLSELGVAQALDPGFGLDQQGIVRRGLELLPGDGDRAALVLGAAMMALPAARARELLDRLAFSAEQRGRILSVAAAPTLAAALEVSGVPPSALAAAVGNAGPEVVALAGALGPAAAAARWLEELRNVRLEITGQDLLAAGVPLGPRIGTGLRAAQAAKLDGQATGREAELAAALAAVAALPDSESGDDPPGASLEGDEPVHPG